MNSVRRSIALSALDSYLGLALQIAVTVILARLLNPVEVGTYAVAAVFAALASTVRDFGVAEFLIQQREPTESQIRAALAVNIGVSWLMAALLLAASPLAALFYKSDEVGAVLRVLACNFVLIPFGAVAMAWHRRNLNFKPILVAGLAANTTSFVVAVTLALRGQGAMSLAWSSLAGIIVTVAVSQAMRPPELPQRPGLAGIGEVLRFGKFASGVYVFGQLGRGAPEMVLGYLLGMAPVAYFSRAWGLVEIFHRLVVRALQPIYLPFFARALREDGHSRGALRHAMVNVTGVGWMFLGLMALAADPAIRIMYGTQWMVAVPLAQVLCLVAAIELVYLPAKEALLADGKARESNRLQIQMQLVRIAGLLPAIHWGLPGACWGLAAAALVGALLSHRALAEHIGWTWREMMSSVVPSAWVALPALAPLALWLWLFPIRPDNSIVVGLVGGAATVTAWLAAVGWSTHPLKAELQRLTRHLHAQRSAK